MGAACKAARARQRLAGRILAGLQVSFLWATVLPDYPPAFPADEPNQNKDYVGP